MRTAASSNPARRKHYVRATPEHRLTATKLEVLRTVALSHFLSTSQVAGVTGLSDKATRDHLRDLLDLGMLEAVAVHRSVFKLGEQGMAPKLHVPTRAGIKALEDVQLLPARAPKRPGETSTLPHHLAVRDTLVWLARSARASADRGHFLERWDCGDVPVGNARPDALFVYRFEHGEEGRAVVGLLEADMGTERAMSGPADRWATKVAAYGAVFQEESRDTLYAATGFDNARIVVTVGTEARALWIARRVAGSPIESAVWIARREDMANGKAGDAFWYRPDGTRQAFVPAAREK
jgi:hypothetical protein